MKYKVRGQKKVCMSLSYTEHLLILASTVTGCVSISDFTSLVRIPVVIASSPAAIKNCVITAEIKKYNSIINKYKKKHDKIVLLAKTKLNTIEVLISKVLINSSISYEEFFSVNKVLREYDDIKEEMKNSNYK